MPRSTGNNETSANAQVLTRQANSTWVAAVTAVLAAVGGGAPAIIKAFTVDKHTTIAQSIVAVGGFVLAAVALLALAMVMSADFRTRGTVKKAAARVPATDPSTPPAPTGGAGSGTECPPLLRVWGKDGAKLPVLGARWDEDGSKIHYLVIPPGGNAPFWMGPTEVQGYEASTAAAQGA